MLHDITNTPSYATACPDELSPAGQCRLQSYDPRLDACLKAGPRRRWWRVSVKPDGLNVAWGWVGDVEAYTRDGAINQVRRSCQGLYADNLWTASVIEDRILCA